MTTRTVKTTDLALATTLTVHGHEPSGMEVDGADNGVWVFDLDLEAHQLYEDYHCGEAEVEPRAFMSCLGKVRGNLFRFLDRQGIAPPHRR